MNIRVRHDKHGSGLYIGEDLDTGTTAESDTPYGARKATEDAVRAKYMVTQVPEERNEEV